MKTSGSPSSPIIVDLNACASNILRDQVTLLEENKKLKPNLRKGSFHASKVRRISMRFLVICGWANA
jgi:hypothetical protein